MNTQIIRNLPVPRLLFMAGLAASLAVILLNGGLKVEAAACPTPASDLGSTTITINAPATATYTVWTRMKAPDTAHNSVNLQVDAATCFNIGGGTFTATSWAAGSGNWIRYQDGVTTNYATLTNLTAGNHTFKYIGTQAGVEVDRIIISSDPSCVPVGTGDNCESGDSTNPTASLQALLGGQAVSNGQTVSGTVNLTSTAADASGIASVQFLIDGNAVSTDTVAPYQYDWNTGGVSNAQHTVAARATDTKNNSTTTANLTVNVSNAVQCTGNPTIPTTLRVTGQTSNSIALAWNASTAATGCTLQNYRVYRDGVQVGTATGTTYNDAGLVPAKAYSYTLEAADTTGHVSAKTAAVPGTTDPDTTNPSTPIGLTVTLKTATSVGLSWTASTDNTAVKDYVIYRNGTQVGVSLVASYTDGAAVSSTTYSYTVKARDLAGNLSAASNAVSATTLAGTNANKGDLNGDNKVTIIDLSIMLSHYGVAGSAVTEGDVNADGRVTIIDLSILLSNWGKTL